MTEVDPKVSKYFSELARRRKNPYLPFKDKEVARKANQASHAAKAKKKRLGSEASG